MKYTKKRGGGKKEIKILGLDPSQRHTLTAKDITTAYRKQSLKVHPDRNKTDSPTTATNKMKELNDARDVLLSKANGDRGYQFVPSPPRAHQARAQAPPQARAQAPPPPPPRAPPSYNWGKFTRENANRPPPTDDPFRGLWTPSQSNFTRSANRASSPRRPVRTSPPRATFTRRKTPSPEEDDDVFARIRRLHRDTVGDADHNILFGNSTKSDSDIDSDDDILRVNRYSKPKKPHKR